jgi:predicted nucleic acid-binding protein
VIFLDTSVLIDSLTKDRPMLPTLSRMLAQGERLSLCTIVLYEWLRGPRVAEELEAQEALFPSEAAFPFDAEDAALSASLYRSLRKPRDREADIAIAACAIRREAELWTLNRADFAGIPRLRLARP